MREPRSSSQGWLLFFGSQWFPNSSVLRCRSIPRCSVGLLFSFRQIVFGCDIYVEPVPRATPLPRRPYGCAVLFTGNPTFSRKFVYIRNVLLAFLEVNTKYGFSLFYPLPFPYIGHFNLRIILSPSVFFSFPNTTPTGYGYPYGIGTHRI